jgi:O-antigen ligase
VAIVTISLVLLADVFRWRRFRSLVLSAVFYSISLALAYGLMLGIVNFEIPGFPKPNIGDLLGSRLGNLSGEAAAASRWQQLPPLQTAIAEHPVFGSGIGRQVTYISNDPRVREKSPDGTYTTYAFEWGYLDFVLKFGVLGTLLFLAPLVIFLRDLWHSRELNSHFLPLIGAFIALAATHMFTPYLNHPLGFGFIVLVASLVSVQKKDTPLQTAVIE